MVKGISLHIGLNEVNAKVYGGKYPLKGCINDAKAMMEIAKSLEYVESILLTDKEATIQGVTESIKSTALKLEAGDMFFLTYSGHGSSVQDLNGDEEDGKDETWCLYDGMLLDDYLYNLWGEFKENVRVVVLSDSCHSGTITKEIHYNLAGGGNRNDVFTYRFINSKIAENLATKDLVLRSQLRNEINCTVKTFAGCQDNQLSRDGENNGLFTSRLLEVWNGGKFTGSYRTFFKEIIKLMPPDQTPNYTTLGKKNSKFDREKPFTV